ncbi:MAG: cytochrome c oxidase accessory protein CcoG [Planctomycetes bacterium]|nr:cytochrome c oxidase accessory protein CcoG [Planctomycetota bacterium]
MTPEEAPAPPTTLLRPEPKVLATLNADGTRNMLRPRLSTGRYHTARRVVAYALMATFALVPFIRVGGNPLLLLDVMERKFWIFGVTFSPTDAPLLALLMLLIFFSIFLMTALAGRVWCGWGCPQTVYMEFLYRPLERLFEGSYTAQQRLDREGMNAQRVLKFMTFLAVSFFVANTFLAYFVGTERLLRWVTHSPLEHPGAFGIMAVTTALMTFDFGYFREQMCTVACPYGRFQSVLLDRQSMIVSYDAGRGEPRGKRRKNAPADAAPVGDCVDCRACVITCPTGIDIRKGLQMECINCTQCMDACDSIMDKLERPRGLIRYTSEDMLAGEPRRLLRPRVLVYAGLVLVLSVGLAAALTLRGAAKVTILRRTATPFAVLPTGEVQNTIRLKLHNRTEETRGYRVALHGADGVRLIPSANPLELAAGEQAELTLVVIVPAEAFSGGRRKLPVQLEISDGVEFTERVDYQLIGPGTEGSPR